MIRGRVKQFFDWRLVHRLLPYIRRHPLLLISAAVCTVLAQVCLVTMPLLIKYAIDRAVGQEDTERLLLYVVASSLVLALSFGAQFLAALSVEVLGQKLLKAVRMDLYAKVLSLSRDYFDKTPTGDTLTNVTNDVEALRQFLSEGIVTVIGQLLLLLLIVIYMLIINVQLSVFALLTVPFFLLAMAVFRRVIRRGYEGVRKANADINATMVESVNGIREIQLFTHEPIVSGRFRRYNTNYVKSFLRIVFSYALFFPVIDLSTYVSMFLILGYGYLSLGQGVGEGDIIAFFAYMAMFFRPLRHLAEKFNTFQSAMAAMGRIVRLLERTPAITSPSSPVRQSKGSMPEVFFDDVHFAYQPGEPVLRGVRFSISPGEKVAIVGHTGAGKSTIIALLNRLYDIQSGSIRIGGTDIRQWDVSALRRTVATVTQDTFLFAGSIYDNIRLFDRSIPLDRVEEAARVVGAHRFIRDLPDGYDHKVLEEGRSLSAGERQLVAFARALVHDGSILVLDEATANIDAQSESLIETAMDRLVHRRTSIIIAHRLATVQRADRILVLHRGAVAEEGDHDTLIARAGIYARLYEMQSLALNS